MRMSCFFGGRCHETQHFLLRNLFHGPQEPLPGPPNPPQLDMMLTDLELFRVHCIPLGDTWEEAGLTDERNDKQTIQHIFLGPDMPPQAFLL